MARIALLVVGAVVAVGASLYVAPILLLGAIALVLMAWKRPHVVGRVSDSPRIRRIPKAARATPMRFAASAAAVALVLTGASEAMGVRGRASPEPVSQPNVAAAATDAPTPVPTERPTQAPTPTPGPTPTPAPTPIFGAEPTGPTESALVTRVIDGDTIEVDLNGQLMSVRYIGMDTPETHNGLEWMGAEATLANQQLVEGRQVVLEQDVSETDQFGRLLRYVWVDAGGSWLLVNLELIRLGVAHVTTYPPDVKYVDALYLPAERAARSSGVGLWGTPPTPVPTPTPVPVTPAPAPVSPAPSSCHASYVGFCVTAGIGDWDCAGGSGNGPNYVPVTVQVVGYDEYGLDGDGDGLGCE